MFYIIIAKLKVGYMEMTYSDVIALPVKERGPLLKSLAESGDNDACLAYAKLIFADKYNGTPSAGQSKDEAKAEARSSAVTFLYDAALRGHLPSIILGQDAAFLGRQGAFNKVLCKVSFTKAIEFLDLWLAQEPEPDDRALALFRKGLCLKLMNAETPWAEVESLWEQSASLGGEHGIAASAQLGARHFDNGRYDEAIPWLETAKNSSMMAASLLMLIHKNHTKSEDDYKECSDICSVLCSTKPKPGQT
ncbi:hypothetical protein MD588_15475 [Photobacterium sp. SDRW27]|uniref:hypothetical protein n=1 Tax=Photobacterium obscurum TaxID=2829490 RepID=UPI002243BC2F|nr:hypothetical protein [Photobacterium obscurum]MCW8330210.1 hypothetical protein [Photobacterium obscurum]